MPMELPKSRWIVCMVDLEMSLDVVVERGDMGQDVGV